MEVFGNNEWGKIGEAFSEYQIEAVLEELGVEVRSETERVFLASCPFHHNPGSPAFAVNKESGLYYCHNPSCGVKGTLFQLVKKIKEIGDLQAKALVHKFYADIDYVALIEKELQPVEYKPYDKVDLGRLKENFKNSRGEVYMRGRGFTDDTLDYFNIGYSAKKDAIIVPMYSDKGIPLGFISRRIRTKFFENSIGLPKSESAWNIHNAKKEGGTVIVCESSFDAMRIHQAGYPNVVALLGGGSISKYCQQQLERYFSTIIIMTDNDPIQYHKECTCKGDGTCEGHNPGRKMGLKIEEKVRRKVLWASSGIEVYPHGAKDAGDLTEEEIRHLLSHAVSSFEYHQDDEERYEYERSAII